MELSKLNHPSHEVILPDTLIQPSALAVLTTRRPPLDTLIRDTLDDLLAENIVFINLHGKSSLADTLVIATGRAPRHLDALADKLKEVLSLRGFASPAINGQGDSGWVIVDAGDTIVHLFLKETRERYNLERMWGTTFSAQ